MNTPAKVVDTNELDELRLKIAKMKGWPFPGNTESGDITYLVDHYGRSGEIPDWPRDIAAAWKLYEEFWQASLYKLADGYLVYVYEKRINESNHVERTFLLEKKASTASEAIARAWLAWKETRS